MCHEYVIEEQENGTSAMEGLCLGFIHGVIDVGQSTSDKHWKICPADPAKVGNIAKVLVKLLEDTPQIHHERASVIVVKLLQKAHPCPS